jgi:hypothetical protein
MARQAFFSFHYQPDNWRVSQVRNVGVIEGNRPATDNDWESITKGGDSAIQKWINDQMKYRSCTVVLVGSETAGRKWINYEIDRSWNERMGIVGIHIHNLKDARSNQSYQGSNPFNRYVGGIYLSNAAKIYNPPYSDSKDVYRYISDNIADWTEEAIKIRENYT